MKKLFLTLRSRLSRYPDWIRNHCRAVVTGSLLATICGGILAATLPLYTEFSWLLPDDQPSVVALKKLTARKVSSAVIEVGVASPSPEATARFAHDLAVALRARLPPRLLRQVDEDDAAIHKFVWEHRHLYVSTGELERIRSALGLRLQRANPLFVDLGDSDAAGESDTDGLNDLRKRLATARQRVDHPTGFVSEQGHLRMLVLRCPFGDTEPVRGREVLQLIEKTVASLHPRSYDAALEVGYAGDPVTAAFEHHLILRDVVITSLLCVLLVLSVLLVAFRVPQAVLALGLTLVAGCALTFGLTRILIGHLNSSTAFLGSVVAGNGINFGIILVWRYLEERRRLQTHADSLRIAISATAVPTLVAAIAAGTAYLSLSITSFRGFSEFGIIAGSGMILCWMVSYSLLPALLSALQRRPISARRPLRLTPVLAPLAPLTASPASLGSRALLFGVVALIGGLSLYGGLRLGRNPFQDDLRALRSRSFSSSPPGRWSRRLDTAFGRDRSGGFYIGAARADDVPVIVRAVREVERQLPKDQKVFGKIDALPEVLPGTPEDQNQKIALLDEIRKIADKLLPHLDPGSEDAALIRDLMPPPHDQLRPLGVGDLPGELQRAFTEADGRVGLLLAIHPGPGFANWSHRSIRRVVDLLRSLPLPDDVRRSIQISGSEVIFADMMAAVSRDGPRASIMSFALVLILLVLAFGFSRDTSITVAALFFATFGMLGLMALFRVRLNFLNFIAVPITIGIGIDYPVNVMARFRLERRTGRALRRALLQTGAAVVLCSATTSIGYAVLLLSDTGAIRSFGSAAVLGELSSVFAAVVLVPSLLLLFGRPFSSEDQPTPGDTVNPDPGRAGAPPSGLDKEATKAWR